MRRIALALALIISVTGFAGDHSGKRGDHDHGYTIDVHDGDDCSRNNFRFNGRRAHVIEETVDARGLRSVKVSAENAPVSITGGSAGGYRIVVCKAAEIESDLALIRVSLRGNELTADGPEDREWTIAYRIETPNGASVDVDSRNGPVAFKNVDGTVVARLANGPLSLRNVTGNVDAVTTNGPISIRGGSGTMKVRASNGPLSVHIEGGSWNGTLDASTKNGPLSVKVPSSASGIVVEAFGHGPISCRSDLCGDWRGSHRMDDVDADYDDRPRRIELGGGPTNVRLSTVNGPVTIREQ